MDILSWMSQVSQSTGTGKGFHAQWIYVVLCVFLPALIGCFITLLIMLMEKVFKIHIGGS